eukprot:GHUV01020804.1.p1 GENE.GHUV01020804.1~~GHUV01020804.1.p1  ORF type:complete len:212 (+),score=16.07 GHUV01020804.1:245-880(+)
MRSLAPQQHQWQCQSLCIKQPRRHICKPIEALSTQGRQQVSYVIRQATSPAELRAAGYLRSYCFYSFPADRSEYAVRTHRRMRGDAEWESVTKKVNGEVITVAEQCMPCKTWFGVCIVAMPVHCLAVANPNLMPVGYFRSVLSTEKGTAKGSQVSICNIPQSSGNGWILYALHSSYLADRNFCCGPSSRQEHTLVKALAVTQVCEGRAQHS